MAGQYECERKAKAEEEDGEKSIEMCHDEWNLNALLFNN